MQISKLTINFKTTQNPSLRLFDFVDLKLIPNGGWYLKIQKDLIKDIESREGDFVFVFGSIFLYLPILPIIGVV
jgi:hypothetical protein